MRLLVCSDSHGAAYHLMLAVDQQPSANIYVFLGDGLDEAEFLLTRRKPAYLLRGNCDGNANYPIYAEFEALGKKILCTHGHYDQVKYGLDMLLYRAQERGAQLCLYGHTHTPLLTYEEGIYLFNPGSLHDGRYGFVDITEAGIVCQNLEVRR